MKAHENRALHALPGKRRRIILLTVLGKIRHAYLKFQFARLGPWITSYRIDGKSYGGGFAAWSDERIPQFFEAFPGVRRILEMGSLEGGHTFRLASSPGVERVVALEGRKQNIRRSRFIQRILRVPNAQFHAVNLEEADLSSLGSFDAVFCSGVLYHLPNPWDLVEKIGRLGPRLFLWTHIASDDASMEVRGFRGQWYQEGSRSIAISGFSSRSYWLTLASLERLLGEHGFENRRVIQRDKAHVFGECVTMAAWKAGIQTGFEKAP
jgi:SAM-dependent methyltransferase